MTQHRAPFAAQLGVALLVAVVVVAGVWFTGGVLTDDAGAAKAATGAWFVLSGVLALVLSRARQVLAIGLVGGWFLTSSVLGGLLLWTSEVDRVVNEDVVMVPTPSGTASASSTTTTARTDQLEARGRFRSGEHETRGTAALVRTVDGRRVVTLTGFATAPGPDLRVYAVPTRSGVRDAVDLGRLKGNKGDQQYDVPASAEVRSVVVWCRAFSVDFGTAVLHDV